MSVDLRALVPAMRAAGFTIEHADLERPFAAFGKFPCGDLSYIWRLNEECPTLCFAMLDVLESRKINVELRRFWGEDKVQFYAKAEGAQTGKLIDNALEPTRTATVAELLIAAHEAGLLSASPQGKTEAVSDKGGENVQGESR